LFEPEALLNRLRAGVDVLRGPASHTLSRHHSMNGAIAASYERLAEPEQHLLRRLALFSDVFDLDEAEAVSELPADILHDRLQSLAEKGLVRVMAGEDGEPYFSLLNTIRGFALNEAARTGRAGADPVLRPATAGGGGLAAFRPEVIPLPRLGLTHREHQVAVLVAEGMTNRQIARQLGIAEWTAVNHVRNVMRKLECSSRVNVASLIAQAGLTG
jgi:DNA-binding CsgD family transcriptional regulator